MFFKKKKKTKKRKTKKTSQSLWVVLRDQGWGALLKKKRKSKTKKTTLKFKLLMFGIWCLIVFICGVVGFWWYAKNTLPDLSKAIYVERARGVKILADDGREITSYGALFSEPVKIDELQ